MSRWPIADLCSNSMMSGSVCSLVLHRQARALSEAEEDRATAAADQLVQEHQRGAGRGRVGFLRRRT